jgi:error-prone DNA polymerase
MGMKRVKEVGYVELHARSAFSFLRAASLPESLADTAARLGLPALALCDRMGVYGIPRLSGVAREAGIRPVVGAELLMEDESVLPVLVEDRVGYENLTRLLTTAHLRSEKGAGRVRWDELEPHGGGLVALTGDEEGPLRRGLLGMGTAPQEVLTRLRRAFGGTGVWVEIQRHRCRGEDRVNRALTDLAASERLPLLATNGVLHAGPEGRLTLDVFTCLRHHTHLDAAGAKLSVNEGRHLVGAAHMGAMFADLPEAVTNTVRLADRLQFTLADLGYEFPTHPVPAGGTMESELEAWTRAGAKGRYPGGVPEKVRALLRKELALIGKLGFAGYFLMVADLVRFCRENGILAQGRGSAANSAVCYCLGITAVDPVRFNVLFERFLSEGRKGWPDIDIDLPSGERRERVIQEVYRRYGPRGAAMTATVISYRGRSAAREIGKALNLPTDLLDRFSALFAHGDFPHTLELVGQMEQAGLSRTHPRAPAFVELYRQMRRLPRHLGQHTGGMIVCQDRLDRIVPLENAAMPGRVVCQWDKDDCEDLGIIKVDLLGLGMMSAIQDCVTLCGERGRGVDLAQLPENDEGTFEMLRAADTIGVFQVESRAQMATLPRMKPRVFYDLVVQVAIIRPGPIQGDLAHPYLRRRDGSEAVTYYDERLRPVLERTLGIPLFQEQMLSMAMVMAGFDGTEAEELRRAISFHRSDEKMIRVTERLRVAMAGRGVLPEVAERIVQAVGSFALYGFPESHAISFAHLAYASAWLKRHRAPEFYCALLNNQPMGFYTPATLVRDARSHGVRVRPVCVVQSGVECRVEPDGNLRLGLNQVQGLRADPATRLVEARGKGEFRSLDDLRSRVRMSVDEWGTLASTGALNALAPHRRAALWEMGKPVREGELPGATAGSGKAGSPLRPMDALERLQADYAGLRLTTGGHPMSLMRAGLPEVWTASDLVQASNGDRIRVAGQVICRQRPGTAKGVCFLSLEDETGITNVIVSPTMFEANRLMLTTEPFLLVQGLVQSRHGTIHVKAEKFEWLDFRLATAASHDFA